jgi:hypothetical protein
MIRSASSKYFEGTRFILVGRPYVIDIIHISYTEIYTVPNGPVAWIVQKVTLFETVACWVPTQEQASFNNGSLAPSRVINWRRTPNCTSPLRPITNTLKYLSERCTCYVLIES